MISNTLRSLSLAALSAAAFAGSAQAQGINIDFDAAFPGGGVVPCSPGYAAAGTAGSWNQIIGGTPGTVALMDKSGAPTAVTMTSSAGLTASLEFVNASFAGDDGNLLNDITYDGIGPATFTFNGLTPGTYDVYTYAIAPDSKAGFVTGVEVSGDVTGMHLVGGSTWGGSHAEGVSYAKHTATVTGGTLVITATDVTSFMSINGIQLESGTPTTPGNAYCFGDGTGATCPCSGFGPAGAGCLNTSGTGATLTGTGSSLLAAGNFVLSVSGGPANKPGLFFQGGNQLANPIGDGILCSNASLRYAVNSTDATGGVTQTGFEANAAVGQTLNYQYWFRDPGNNCGGGFNFTNGWVLTWQ
jgi:hypothetical protein